MRLTKRLLAVLLMVCMVFSMLPAAVLTASAADVTIASWGKVSLAKDAAVDAATYEGTTAPTMTSNKAMTSSGTHCYFGSAAGGATITISGLPSGYTTKEITFYTRASQQGNMNVSISTDGGTTYTSVGSASITKTEALKTITLSEPTSNVTNIKFEHSKTSGSLYFGTVTVTGEAASSSYTVTASASPAAGGTVTVSGNTITAVPNEGYRVTGTFVADNGIAVEYNGDNTFTFTATANGEVLIEFALKTTAVLTYSENGAATHEEIAYVGDSVTLLAPQNAAPAGYTFMGWLPTTYATNNTAPTGLLRAGDSYTLPTEYCTLYAVYAKAGEGGGSGGWTETALNAIADGTRLVIVSSKESSRYALSNDKGTSSAPSAVSVTASGTSLASDPADTIIWTLEKSDGGYRFKSGTNYLYCNNANNGVRVGTNTNNVFTVDTSGYLKNKATSRFIGVYNNSDWRCYTSTTTNIGGQTFIYYAEQAGTSYTGYTTNVDSSVTYTLDSIAITTPATKTEFSLGEAFTYDGMVVTATYAGSNGSTTQSVVTPTSVSAPDMTTAGVQTVTVTYTENGVTKTTTYQITVKATYTLTYNANTTDEVTNMPADVTGLVEGTVYTLSTDAPVRKGYDFYGWAASADSDVEIKTVTMDGNKTVYAIWLEKTQYTVSYYAKDGDAPVSTKTYYDGDTISAADVPTIDAPDGFAFKGWYGATYGGATAPAYITPAGTTVKGNLTFRAVYAELGEGGDTFTLARTYSGTTYYAGARSGNNSYLSAPTSQADAASFRMESTGTAGKYYIYDVTDGLYLGWSSGTSLAFSASLRCGEGYL